MHDQEVHWTAFKLLRFYQTQHPIAQDQDYITNADNGGDLRSVIRTYDGRSGSPSTNQLPFSA